MTSMSLKNWIGLIFIISCLATGRLMAKSGERISINGTHTLVDLNNHTLRFTDSTSSLSISEIMAIPGHHWVNQRLSGRSQHDVWVKYQFENLSSEAFDKILYINNLYLLNIDVFFLNNGLLQEHSVSTGLSKSNTTKPYQDPMYPVTVSFPANSKVSIYIKISDSITAIHNDIFFLMDAKQAYALNAKRLLFSSIWLGILFTSIVVSIFLYWTIRREIFVYYVLLGISTALVIGTNVGFVSLVLDRDPYQMVGNLYQIGAALMMISMPRFLNCIVPIKSIQSVAWKISCWVGYFGMAFALSYCLPLVKYHATLGPIAISGLTLVSAFVFLYLLAILGIGAFKKLKRAKTLFLVYSVNLGMALVIAILPHLGMDTKEINSFLFLIGTSTFEIVAFLLLMAQVTLDIYRERERLNVQVQNNQIIMMNAIVKSQEDERKRFSADLHDGLGQMITALGLKISSIQSSPETKKEGLVTLSRNILDDMYVEVKNICFNLMPQSLIRSGVGAALKEVIPRLNTDDKLEVSIYTHNLESRLSQVHEISIYRIAQEWLNNVIKYSHATQIDLNLTQDESELTLSIEDNGDGFDELLFTASQNGNGWKNISSRATLIKGEVLLDTMPGRKGTTFVLNIPFEAFAVNS